MKQDFKTISVYVVVFILLAGVAIIGIQIDCGLDIFRISDLANFIGREHIEHVTIEDDHIDIILKPTAVHKEENEIGISHKNILVHADRLSSYINGNERYKDMKIRVRYNHEIYDQPLLIAANYSLSGRNEERYDGLHSVRFFYCGGYNFEILTAESCKDIREVYLDVHFPENTEAIQHLTNLEYLCLKCDEIGSSEKALRSDLKKYAHWCTIELSVSK